MGRIPTGIFYNKESVAVGRRGLSGPVRVAAFTGIVLIVIGALMVCTVVLFPLGIPAFVLGVLLLARSVL